MSFPIPTSAKLENRHSGNFALLINPVFGWPLIVFRFGVMAGSAMPEDLLSRVMTKFPIPAIYTNWGMTELSSIATMTTEDDAISKKMKTAGRLLPHFSAKIVHPGTGVRSALVLFITWVAR